MYIIFTIIFGKIEGTIFELMGEIGEGAIAPSPMSQFSGFNLILFVILIIAAGLRIFFMFFAILVIGVISYTNYLNSFSKSNDVEMSYENIINMIMKIMEAL